ncbi:MAG: inositol monophosphatase, partial [Clostridia bacterium]|nr:inositol monophosphatase [Clostridia bacterium]
KYDSKRLYEVTARIMRRAGEIILSAHDPESPDCLHSKPGTQNFVTDYDIAVQKYIIDSLKEAFPSAGFIGEEKENDESLLNGELCFIIDPIDGTTNFIHNCRMSCISVGAVSEGKVVYGAVYNPYSGKLVHAAAGEGCYEDDRRVSVSDRPMEMSVAVYGTCPYYKDTLSEKTFSMAREVFCSCVDIHRTGSAAIDLCSVATGSCDLFFELILQPWDYAAGKLIVEEAGGIITAADGSPLTLDRPSSVICGTPITYPRLLKIASKYVK